MSKKKRWNIAVLIGGVRAYFPELVIKGIRDAAAELDMDVCFFVDDIAGLFSSDNQEENAPCGAAGRADRLYDYSLLSGADGIIIHCGSAGDCLKHADLNAFAGRYGLGPIVVLDGCSRELNCGRLTCDNEQGMRLIIEHLTEKHGYRKILYMSGLGGHTAAAERRMAYLDVMREKGLECSEAMIGEADCFENADREVERLLDRNPDAEAIVFADDEMALAGYRVLAGKGLTAGKDIAVAGYDECGLAKEMDPPLTAAAGDSYEMGRQAVFDITARLEGKTVGNRILPVKFTGRESCGCEAKELTSYEAAKILEEYRKLSRKAIGLQRRSWLVPHLTKDLGACMNDEEQYYRQIMINLKYMFSCNIFMFIEGSSEICENAGSETAPRKLYLTSYLKDGRAASYMPGARPEADRAYPMSEFMNDEEARQYIFLPLSAGGKQFGVIAGDIRAEDFYLFHMVSLQLGLMLRYQEFNRTETAYMIEMSRNMEQMRRQNHELGIKSGVDELTGLLNLRGFMEQVKKLRPENDAIHACMVYGDLDHLKEINDTWGHEEGNFAICSAGRILKDCLRDTDVLGRIGGDEFVALVPTEPPTFEMSFRRRVEQACRKLNDTSGKPYYVELSLGIEPFEFRSDTNIQSVMSRADSLLYEHKKSRRKSVSK